MISDELLDMAYSNLREKDPVDPVTFNKVITELRKNEVLNSECLDCFSESYNISTYEMMTVFNFLYNLAFYNTEEPYVNSFKDSNKDELNEIVYLFKFDDFKFAIRLQEDQRTAYQMFAIDEKEQSEKYIALS